MKAGIKRGKSEEKEKKNSYEKTKQILTNFLLWLQTWNFGNCNYYIHVLSVWNLDNLK